MPDWLLVGLGGFCGAVARYAVTLTLTPASLNARFPLSTLVVNVVGCLCIGALAAGVELLGSFSTASRMLLFAGVLGGFTTYSAFGYETFLLARDQGWGVAAANIIAQVVLGLGAVWAGHAAVSAVAR